MNETENKNQEPFAAVLDSAKLADNPIDTKKLVETAPTTGAATLPAPAERDAHHAYGPSKWPALLSCPCYESKPPTADTERGTDLHALFEKVMNGGEAEPTDSFEYHVIQAARGILHTARAERFYTETRVNIPIDRTGAASGIFGRLDLAWFDSVTGDLHVVDLKFVENPDRDHRPQLLAYATGILAAHQEAKPQFVFLSVLYADSGKMTEERIATSDAWTMHEANYADVDDIAKGFAAELYPHQCGWCDLCANYASCRAARKVAETVSATLADVPERWPEFSSARKAQLCALAEAVAKWAAAVKERAGEDAKAGEAIEDPEHGIFYEVRERAGKLYLSTTEAWAVVRQFIDPDTFKECCDVSQTRLVEALKAAGKKAKEAKALLEAAGTRAASTLMFVRKGVRA